MQGKAKFDTKLDPSVWYGGGGEGGGVGFGTVESWIYIKIIWNRIIIIIM